MKQTWDLYRCNKNTLVLSQKQREVIYLITKEYEIITLLTLPYDLKYLLSLNHILTECLWSWSKHVLDIFYLQVLSESPVDHLQIHTTEVKSASANHSESAFMKGHACSATGSILCAKNYCSSPITFSVSSDIFFLVQFKVWYFAHKTFYLLTPKYLKDLLCLLCFISVAEINWDI